PAKKGYSVFLMAAASVMLVLAAGLWFYRSPDVIRLQGAPRQIAESKEEIKIAEPVQVVPEQNNDAAAPVLSALTAGKEWPVSIPENIPAGKNTEQDHPEAPADVRIAEAKQRRAEPDLPSKAIIAPSVNEAGELQPGITEPAVAVNTLAFADEDLTEDQDAPARKKITSIGSLVNFVVSRVDHREDKIIEFMDGEEGSEVSGINL